MAAVGNGTCLSINNINSLVLKTPRSKLCLQHVLPCPQAMDNLLSINKFCVDNDCFFILTDSHYFLKDKQTGITLLARSSERGLYPFHLNKVSLNKCRTHIVFFGVKTSFDVWYTRLGHPSAQVIRKVVHSFHLPLEGMINLDHLCHECQLGKSKKLPFTDSNRISSEPLE